MAMRVQPRNSRAEDRTLVDDVTWVEALIQSRLPDRFVYQDTVGQDGAEIQIQNLPSKRPALVRVLFQHADALAMRGSAELARDVALDIAGIVTGADTAKEVIVDLREIERGNQWRQATIVPSRSNTWART